MLVSKATDNQFAGRLQSAVNDLRCVGILGCTAFKEMSALLGDTRLETLSTSDLLRVESILRNVTDRFGAYAVPGIERGEHGRPLLKLGAKYKFLAFTDCVGGDPETASRIAIEEGSILSHFGIPGGHLQWQQTEPLNPAHIRGVVTSTYLSYLEKYRRGESDLTEQLVLLANAAPRDPDNPNAKGCPFVVAVLEGDVVYVGTLNRDGTELQGIKDHIVELWHTTLGVEETGVEGGKAPKSVFRSKHLLSLFRELVKGNEALLDRKMDIAQEVLPIQGVQIDSRDSFGNLKTTASFQGLLDEHRLEVGDSIRVSVGEVCQPGRVAMSHGDGQKDEILLVRGSSPFSINDESDTRADIVINSGDASGRFTSPNEAFAGRVWAGKTVEIIPRLK